MRRFAAFPLTVCIFVAVAVIPEDCINLDFGLLLFVSAYFGWLSSASLLLLVSLSTWQGIELLAVCVG